MVLRKVLKRRHLARLKIFFFSWYEKFSFPITSQWETCCNWVLSSQMVESEKLSQIDQHEQNWKSLAFLSFPLHFLCPLSFSPDTKPLPTFGSKMWNQGFKITLRSDGTTFPWLKELIRTIVVNLLYATVLGLRTVVTWLLYYYGQLMNFSH